MKIAWTISTVAIASIATVSHAQERVQTPPTDEEIVVTAQQQRPQVTSEGSLGALGDRSALETPFNVRNYTAQLILDQQAETLGEVLENDPSVRIAQGFGNQSELFVIRGFPLAGDDVALDGLYGITPRQLVSPELYDRVQVLNGSSAFLFGAAPGGSGLGGGINLIPKRAEKTLMRATASYAGDHLFGGAIDLGTRFGAGDAFGFRVNGVYRDGDTAVDDERRSVRVVGADLDFRSGPGRFFLDFGYEDQRICAMVGTDVLTCGCKDVLYPRAATSKAAPAGGLRCFTSVASYCPTRSVTSILPLQPAPSMICFRSWRSDVNPSDGVQPAPLASCVRTFAQVRKDHSSAFQHSWRNAAI